MKYVVILFFLVAAGAGAWFYMNNRAQADAAGSAANIPTRPVTRMTLEKVITANGKIASNRDVDIKCKASGEVIALPFDISQAVRKGAVLSTVTSADLFADPEAWAIPVANPTVVEAGQWAAALADLASAISATTGVAAPVTRTGEPSDGAKAAAASLLGGERKAVLLGNAVAHHAQASTLLALANWIGTQTGASVGFLTEAANTVGAQVVGAVPKGEGRHAGSMLSGGLKALLLLNTEPVYDSAAGDDVVHALAQTDMVVTLSPFKANLEFSDVLLPIAPFTETPGTFVNAEGRAQSFHAVVRPLGETRPGWKVLRVLANMLGLSAFGFESTAEVLEHLRGRESELVPTARLSNATRAAADAVSAPGEVRPVVASIYQLDSIVRRAPSLQLTADARAAVSAQAPAVLEALA